MSKNQKIWAGVVAIAVIAFIVWRVGTAHPNSNGGITIGVAVAETGDAAEWGEGELRIAQMYVDDVNARGGINGEPIQLISEDTKSTGVGTVNAVRKLIDIDNVPAIFGPTWVDSYQGALPIAEAAKAALLTPSAAIESIKDKDKYSYLFSTWWPQAPEVSTVLSFMAAQNVKTLAIINDLDPFDVVLTDSLAAESGAKGMSVVAREQVPTTQNDFRTQILKIKQSRPDSLFVQISNVAGLGPFMKQVKDLGLSARVFTSPDAQNQDAISKFGPVMEGLTYPFLKTPSGKLYEDFVSEYKARYDSLPSAPSTVCAYNAIAALISVLKSGARTGTEIRDGLNRVNVPGIGVATIAFNSRGQITAADFEMKMVHNSQFVTIPQQ